VAKTYDIHLAISSPEDGTLPFSLGGPSTKYMSGFYKTIIKWAKCLLTSVGSDLSDPTYGTVLADAAGSVGGTEDILRDMATMAVLSATKKLKEYQAFDDLPDEEILTTVAILDVALPSPDVLHLTVRFVNAANDRMALRMPIDIVPSRSVV